MPLGPGGLALMPARANHAAYAKGKMTVFPFGQGPIEFTYVSTSDDSRSKTSTSRK